MMRKGFTLIECVLAASLICIVTLGIFEGVITASRITHENSEFMAADALAWDVVWKRFNEPYGYLSAMNRKYSNPVVDTAKTSDGKEKSAAPVLWYGTKAPVKVYTVVTNATLKIKGYSQKGVMIHVNVEWGPENKRCSLAPVSGKKTKHFNHDVSIFRGAMERGS